MPVGNHKNVIYGLALPLIGKRCRWSSAIRHGDAAPDQTAAITRVLKRNHVVGASVQTMRDGALAACYTAGNAHLNPNTPVTPDTYFRTASIAKMACALLVMRLQTLGKLDVQEDISALWGKLIRNPNYPQTPIPLAALLSHTSGLADSPLFYSAYEKPVDVDTILRNTFTYTNMKPFERFRYSNFAAGLIGSLLEARFQVSLEALAQSELFAPLGVRATFDITTLGDAQIANAYRVLPSSRLPAFNAMERFHTSTPLNTPDPSTHYLLSSGNLYITAAGLMRLCLPLVNGGSNQGEPFLDERSLRYMLSPTTAWPEPQVRMRHGLGLLEVEDAAIHPTRLHGHQGFAYGAVNGVFFDDKGNGFASLNSGASEMRIGHLSCLNRDLIRVLLGGASHA